MNYRTVREVAVTDKVVLLRLDLNVPVDAAGKITSDFRVRCALPTLNYLVARRAKVVVLSHLGRVKTKEDLKTKSLRPVADCLRQLLPATKVSFVNDIEGQNLEAAIAQLNPGQVLVMENTRLADVVSITGHFDVAQQRESGNSEQLGRYWASLGQVFVNDAFAMAHRAHASNAGIARFITEACVGLLVVRETTHLQRLVDSPPAPYVAFVGGAKVSDKIKLLKRLLAQAHKVVIGGAMAFTFLRAQNVAVGKSPVEDDQVPLVKEYLQRFADKIVLPCDFVTNHSVTASNAPVVTANAVIAVDMMGLDAGTQSLAAYRRLVATAKTIFWNGPFGLFEQPRYAAGTAALCTMIAARQHCYRVVGGGDSVAMVTQLHKTAAFDFVSSGGGATLAFISGEPLPGLQAMPHQSTAPANH